MIQCLSRRELQLLRILCEAGAPNREIALKMGVIEQTVRNSLRLIYLKTGTENRLQLAMFAFRNGIAELPGGDHGTAA